VFKSVRKGDLTDKLDKNIMDTKNDEIDKQWKWGCTVGGIALVLEGVLYALGSYLSTALSAMPDNSQVYVNAVAAHPGVTQSIAITFGLADVLLVPVMLGLYQALKRVNKNAMVVAVIIMAIYIPVDLATFIHNSFTIAGLTQTNASMASMSNLLATIPLSQFLGFFLNSLALLIVSFVMLGSVYRRRTAILGIVFTLLGILGGIGFLYPSSFFVALQLPSLLLCSLWCVLSGGQTIKLSRRC
jgi:hypothetical protein